MTAKEELESNEKLAKFILSDGKFVFVAYRPRRNENILQRLRNLIEELMEKKVKSVEPDCEGGDGHGLPVL